MTTTLTYTLGKFVWRELFTNDVAAAKRFYGGMFGWTFDDRPMGPDWSYTIVKTGDKEIAGIMDLANMPEGSGDIPPNWSVYVSVADVDQTVEKAVSLGAQVLGDCHDIPGVGRFAVMQDPQGAVICLFRSLHGDPEDRMPRTHEFCWESLMTPDADKAIAFYTQVIGWGTMKMEGSETPLFSRPGMDETLASIGPVPPGAPPHWSTFVAVEDIDASTAKCSTLGGQVMLGRTEIPNVGAFAILQDPTGAVIFLFQAAPAC